MSEKYNLVGVDGNAWSVMGYVANAMRREGFKKEDIDKYQKDAMSGDYDHLLAISAKIVDKLNNGEKNLFDDKMHEESKEIVLKDFTKEEIEKQEILTQNLYDKYVPAQGQGNNRISQILTAYSKLAYKWYNDGDVYDNTYNMKGRCNDISGSANWLYRYVPETRDILNKIKVIGTDDEYTNIIRNLEFLLNNEEFLKKYENLPVVGDAYDEEGPFEFVENCDDEDCTGSCWDCDYRDDCESNED